MAGGFRAPILPFGISAPPPAPVQAGYRSLLAFWMGGVSSSPQVQTGNSGEHRLRPYRYVSSGFPGFRFEEPKKSQLIDAMDLSTDISMDISVPSPEFPASVPGRYIKELLEVRKYRRKPYAPKPELIFEIKEESDDDLAFLVMRLL